MLVYIAAFLISIRGRVDGITYRNMLDFAIKYGFSKKQLDELFIWRIGFISKKSINKRKGCGN